MKRVALVLVALLASASIAEAQRKALGCTVRVEIKDAVDSDGNNSALIDAVTNTQTRCEFTGKVKFLVNNSSDIDIKVTLNDFKLKAGGICSGAETGGAVNVPISNKQVTELKFSAGDQGDDKEKLNIHANPGTGPQCFKFDVYLYKKDGRTRLDYLDPELELAPPSGPNPAVTSGAKKP